MERQSIARLYDKDLATAFYQERYSRGYMDEWPPEKKRRIFELLRTTLDLPASGEALDFGCGNGIFTDVLRQALPLGWRIYGTDISETAIANARKRYPECLFFPVGDPEFVGKRFDFLFTHHVLEHVHSLADVLDQIDDHLKDASTMLHVLPCGNRDSFEHGICALRKDGIDSQLENRYFFEDEGHVRRLDTKQLTQMCMAKRFRLTKEYYSNQYYGAIEWITAYSPSFLRFLTDPSLALDEKAATKLKKLRYMLFLVWALRYPTVCVDSRLRKRTRTLRDYIVLALTSPLYALMKPIDSYLKNKARVEWEEHKTERHGSEMYLFFSRRGGSIDPG